jgi:hypothetical protein
MDVLEIGPWDWMAVARPGLARRAAPGAQALSKLAPVTQSHCRPGQPGQFTSNLTSD